LPIDQQMDLFANTHAERGSLCDRFADMQSIANIEPANPTVALSVHNPVDGVIYLVPSVRGLEGRLAYVGTDALLMKQAVADGIPLEYAVPEERREFVDHYSEGFEVIGLAIAIVNLVPSTIQGIQALFELAAMRRGYQGEAARRAKVELKIDYLKTPNAEARGLNIKGDAQGVVEALRELRRDS
jgi:hypothetical protein